MLPRTLGDPGQLLSFGRQLRRNLNGQANRNLRVGGRVGGVETMIEISTGEIKQCTCGLCGYSWQTLSKTPPSICPSCRSRQWNGKKRTGRPPAEEIELTLPSPNRIRITEEI